MSFEVGVVGLVSASHVMPGRPPPEGELHVHDYRVHVTVEGDDLDEAGMVVDLDVLRAALDTALAQVKGADLGVRLRMDEVTVERFAAWVHGRMAEAIGSAARVTIRVRVWEGSDAFGGYAAPAG
jgi:6-pyruvoyltetrahydropterin/6-carboxytetrahydropterin synthase